MGSTALTCCILCLLMGQAIAKCRPQNYTLYMERKECDHCMTINTTICSGFCYSRDSNMRGPIWKPYMIQRTCVYQSLVYRTAKLPGCPSNVDPLFSYPVALQCHCSRCNTTSIECVQRARRTSTRCSKSIRHVGPSLG
ncbi:thyrotropin subunit beta-like [Megalops cyprinoides]|uniref:thyrotropin subunit beta-like n=1 Tax=Megalops cyprinoides TaxID=118141 RepID=UPI001865441C|nr:thyrotropin subunit beta-like [Megalops cyprinoides]